MSYSTLRYLHTACYTGHVSHGRRSGPWSTRRTRPSRSQEHTPARQLQQRVRLSSWALLCNRRVSGSPDPSCWLSCAWVLTSTCRGQSWGATDGHTSASSRGLKCHDCSARKNYSNIACVCMSSVRAFVRMSLPVCVCSAHSACIKPHTKIVQ